MDSSRAPVAYGHWAVPQLCAELRRPEADRRQRAQASLCDLIRDPETLLHALNAGLVPLLKVLLQDENQSIRVKTCELLYLLAAHSIGRQAILSSSLLSPLSQLLDSCRRSVLLVMNRLSLLPAGAQALLALVPKLMEQLVKEEEEDEVLILLLSTLSVCFTLDALPALASDAVSVVGQRLSHRCTGVRREALAAMMALSVPVEGKQRVCEEAVLPVLVRLLSDRDVDVQTNSAGVLMNTVIITSAKLQCVDLDVVPLLLGLISQDMDEEGRKKRKGLLLYALQALSSLAEAPPGRRLLLQRLPLLTRWSTDMEGDQDVRRAAQTAVSIVTWTP
ncbi:radial spoke head 14 homolog [Genypterus blacodes]|uniref:radial spoke head 14 homolog n=1 Tax=Genypterus blacodes TaxID=154954 RepID=UPI003F775B0E